MARSAHRRPVGAFCVYIPRVSKRGSAGKVAVIEQIRSPELVSPEKGKESIKRGDEAKEKGLTISRVVKSMEALGTERVYCWRKNNSRRPVKKGQGGMVGRKGCGRPAQPFRRGEGGESGGGSGAR